MSLTRRDFLVGSAALAAGATVTSFFLAAQALFRSTTEAISSCDPPCAAILPSAVINFSPQASASSPGSTSEARPWSSNPTWWTTLPGDAINTHPMLVLAAAESFRRMGAKSVVVAEGPGHQRDTQLVLSQSGYEQSLREEKIRFVDLNRDELIRTPLRASFTGMRNLWLPRTVLEADFLVSMPKIKTHHWSGVTLSMKNMFGVVPGARYGWPKNILHWKGIRRASSISAPPFRSTLLLPTAL